MSVLMRTAPWIMAFGLGCSSGAALAQAPGIEALPVQALDVAQSLALKQLAKTPDARPAARSEYTWASVAVGTTHGQGARAMVVGRSQSPAIRTGHRALKR